MKFYKGVLAKELKANYIPGTITTDIAEAQMWTQRISSKKRTGVSRHLPYGKSVVICMDIDESTLLDHTYFQQSGVTEHRRENCWTSLSKTKAQVNTPVSYTILKD